MQDSVHHKALPDRKYQAGRKQSTAFFVMQGARPERQSEQSRRRALRHSFQVRSPGRLVCRGPKQRTDTRLVLGISSFCIEDGLISARTAFGKSLSALTHSEGKIRHESSIKALFRSPSPPAPPGGSVQEPARFLPAPRGTKYKGGCLGCFGRSDLGPVPSGRGNSASRWPLQLKLGDRRHAHMSSSDAEFQRKRPAGRAATAFFCMP